MHSKVVDDEDLDVLKAWILKTIGFDVQSEIITGTYQVLTEAHPLAKYVVALVKKDKPFDALRTICLDQLVAFFQGKDCEIFVDELFKCLKNRSFLNIKRDPEYKELLKFILTNENRLTELNSNDSSPTTDSDEISTSQRELSYQEKANSPQTRIRSVSPSSTRRRRLRSRTRSPSAEKDTWRNGKRKRREDYRARSPVEVKGNLKTLTQSSRYSPVRNRSPAGRSPNLRKSPQDKKSPPRRRSRSPIIFKSGNVSGATKPAVSSIVTLVTSSTNNMNNARRGAYSAYGNAPTQFKERCIDYEKKGFCLMGEMCLKDHSGAAGPIAVLSENISAVRLPGMGGRQMNRFGAMSNTPMMQQQQAMQPMMSQSAYIPQQHQQMVNMQTAQNLPFTPQFAHQNQVFQPQQQQMMSRVPGRVGGPQGNNTEFAASDYNAKTTDTNIVSSNSIELLNIPEELNTVLKLAEWANKFGKVRNISCTYQGDKQKALIEFSSQGEAKSALDDAEPVMNNRFIKKNFKQSSSQSNRPSIQDRLGFRNSESDRRVQITVKGSAQENQYQQQQPREPVRKREIRVITRNGEPNSSTRDADDSISDESALDSSGLAPSHIYSRFRGSARSRAAPRARILDPSAYTRHAAYPVPSHSELKEMISEKEGGIVGYDDAIKKKRATIAREDTLFKKLIAQRKVLKTKLDACRNEEVRLEINELLSRSKEAMIECTKRKNELFEGINKLEEAKIPYEQDLSFLKVQEEMQTDIVNKELKIEEMKEKDDSPQELKDTESALEELKNKLQRHIHAREKASRQASMTMASRARGSYRGRGRAFRSRGYLGRASLPVGRHTYSKVNSTSRPLSSQNSNNALSQSASQASANSEPDDLLNLDEPVYDDDDDDDDILQAEAGLDISTDDIETQDDSLDDVAAPVDDEVLYEEEDEADNDDGDTVDDEQEQEDEEDAYAEEEDVDESAENEDEEEES